jgi:hypothetical protein
MTRRKGWNRINDRLFEEDVMKRNEKKEEPGEWQSR